MPLVDFTDSIDPFAPIPQGTYRAEVLKVSERIAGEEAKHPGSPYLAIEFLVQDEPYQTKHLWMNASMHPEQTTIGMLKRTLLSLGVSEEDLSGSFEIDPDSLVGKECRLAVTVGKNPATGEPNNSVKRILPVDTEESVLPS